MAAPLIDTRALRRLDALLVKLAGASADGDVEKMLTANQHFMFEVYRAARAPLLLSMIETLWLRRGPMYWGARGVFMKWRGRLPISRHKATVAALRARDGHAAAAAIGEEIDITTAFLLKEIRFAGDPAPPSGVACLAPLRPGRPAGAPPGATPSRPARRRAQSVTPPDQR
jgi:DNA-binding GntR family transcriptional regulator